MIEKLHATDYNTLAHDPVSHPPDNHQLMNKLNEVIDKLNSIEEPCAANTYEESCAAAIASLQAARLPLPILHTEQKPTFTKEQRLEQLDRVMLATKRAMSLRKHNTTEEELEFYWNKYDIEIDKLKEML